MYLGGTKAAGEQRGGTYMCEQTKGGGGEQGTGVGRESRDVPVWLNRARKDGEERLGARHDVDDERAGSEELGADGGAVRDDGLGLLVLEGHEEVEGGVEPEEAVDEHVEPEGVGGVAFHVGDIGELDHDLQGGGGGVSLATHGDTHATHCNTHATHCDIHATHATHATHTVCPTHGVHSGVPLHSLRPHTRLIRLLHTLGIFTKPPRNGQWRGVA